MGGTGGSIAYNLEEFQDLVEKGLSASPISEVLIEESLLGWKEFEMEVVRDSADNAIIICSIENLDPMGVHTGDSITVAPSQTLTDKEYQKMRNWSILCLRTIGVDTGGSNVQFAVNPENGRMIIIEMNPRVSRSSALASKATGFPIAKIAAKLAVGYTLDELPNDITGQTLAAFEPSIDYVVTKIPRFDFEKFPSADGILGVQMQSVGEVMAIGRTFRESLQKAFRSLEVGLNGFEPKETEYRDLDLGKIGFATASPTSTACGSAGKVSGRRAVCSAFGAVVVSEATTACSLATASEDSAVSVTCDAGACGSGVASVAGSGSTTTAAFEGPASVWYSITYHATATPTITTVADTQTQRFRERLSLLMSCTGRIGCGTVLFSVPRMSLSRS